MESCTHNHVAGKHLHRVLMAVMGLILLLIPLALSLVWRQKKDMTGLTLWTLNAAQRKIEPTPAPTMVAPEIAVAAAKG